MAALAGQTNSTLCSSSINYAPACLGGHSFSKSVVSGPSDSARLERAFHIKNPYTYIELFVLYRFVLRMRASSGFENGIIPEILKIKHMIAYLSSSIAQSHKYRIVPYGTEDSDR